MAGALPIISGSGGSNCSFLGIESMVPGEEATAFGRKSFCEEIRYHGMPDDATPIARELSKKDCENFRDGADGAQSTAQIQSPEYLNIYSSRMIERTGPAMWYGHFASTEDQINSREIEA